jgi:YD repeat-containing protein
LLCTILSIISFSILPLAVITSRSSAQQGGTSSYVYDDDGRLHAVLSPSGEAAVYEYDDAGNFTAIRRLTPNDLELISFTPHQGPVGTLVTIFGTGFNQGVNSVSFNGVTATIVSVNLVSVAALVPQSATTGLISVTTPRGAITTTTPFTVKGVLISPRAVTLPASGSTQFTATVSGTATGVVTWSVNGVAGGTATVGTISTNGFYTAPNLSGSNTVQYIARATSVDDPELFDEGVVNVIPFGAGYQFRSGGLSVRYGTPPNNSPTYINGAVSVRYGTPPNTSATYINGAVSVRYGTPPNISPAFVGGAVSATRGPVLNSLAPSTISRGTGVTLTISGVALNGANAVSLFNQGNGNPASGITISNINVNGSGTSLTCTITVAGNVAVGGYIVVVTTSSGSTVRNDTGSNIVQIN